MKAEVWCWQAQRLIEVEGVIIGKRQADMLRINRCSDEDKCPFSRSENCLVGRELEGRWP